MGKMSELAMLILELRTTATAIINTADALEELFGSAGNDENSAPKTAHTEPATADEQPSDENLKQKVYDAIVYACRNGLKPQAKALLGKYGADRFSAVKPADYEALLRDLEDINHAS